MTAVEPTLFDTGADLEPDAPVRASDPDTSVAAARQVQDTAGNDRLAVVDAITRLGGSATTDQIRAEMASMGIRRDRNCVASRISQLQKPRYGARLVDSGRRSTKTPGRPPVIVWTLT